MERLSLESRVATTLVATTPQESFRTPIALVCEAPSRRDHGGRAEVDELIEKAEAAGAAVTLPRDRPWGIYSGYVRDLDGHLWEIIWNPNRG